MLGFQIPVYNSRLQAFRTAREGGRPRGLRDLEDFEGAGVPNPSLQFQVTGFSHQRGREASETESDEMLREIFVVLYSGSEITSRMSR